MESDKVNMTLDEIIKMNKPSRGRGKGRRGAPSLRANSSFSGVKSQNFGRGRGNLRSPRQAAPRGGVTKRTPNRQNFIPRNIEGIWTHDLFEGTAVTEVRGEGKLLISNLDYGVSDTDMKQLFSEFGQLKKAAVHYDASGRSLGTAEVIFSSKRDAMRAMAQYDKVPLDGRPMKIQIVGGAPANTQVVTRSPVNAGAVRGRGGRVARQYAGGNKFGSSFGSKPIASTPRRGAGGRGRGRGGRGQKVNLTREQLDEQLDNYNRMDTE